ncbi:ATP-binding protein [Methylovulum psychrotolerans]|uniref:Uncharacterized protein n=1 Tax=Methylovulum psychrotolerans TaxID=1704499 RepID=A0A2S5CT15_9GAMM|nr:ATP-binding protein [Methylovulum psychrotolerans]POZ53944.1 hypothetical protein AADEFJLK_00986 [Methylovulum psychrotolerans]
MPIDPSVLRKLYNAFEPQPLDAGNSAYVDCQELRGDCDILQEMGRKIVFSDKSTCLLYTGLRGAGKSTELLRLKQYLEDLDYKVVYFSADEEDIDPEDARYTDILLACTRRLLQSLNADQKNNPVVAWLKSRWQSLKELAATEVEIEDISIEIFAKITANLRTVPSLRQKIRNEVDPYTVSLIEALNEFIAEAMQKTPQWQGKVVLIADNLDRIVPVTNADTHNLNHDEIFLDRSEQLRALNCHVIYTVPISMAYSQRAIRLIDCYGAIEILPMIKVWDYAKDDTGAIVRTENPQGINKLKRIIEQRIIKIDSTLTLEAVFEDQSVLEELCLRSGGHVRNLILLFHASIIRTSGLPVTVKAMRRALSEMRDVYRRTVADADWEKLAKVHKTKDLSNKDDYRRLLFDRCVLEYREVDDDQKITTWYDVHPLIEELNQFQQALSAI